MDRSKTPAKCIYHAILDDDDDRRGERGHTNQPTNQFYIFCARIISYDNAP
jgi:hypothetical protein